MYAIVINQKQTISAEQGQSLAKILGVTLYDIRQRLIHTGPLVVSVQAETIQAEQLVHQLQHVGLNAFSTDIDLALNKRPVFHVRSFKFGTDRLHVFDSNQREAAIPYRSIRLILPVDQTSHQTEIRSVSERKLSIGKTVMMGGLPMSKKVVHNEDISRDSHERTLYLCGGKNARLVCPQDGMRYDSFADEKTALRTVNFNLFVTKVRQKCAPSAYDEALKVRAGRAKLLGPTLDPDNYVELAVDILATSVKTDKIASSK
ncbi:MAG: hypothetical protein C0622_03975 [Desulfuromonas sp.]|nr:MAG: hypothetical protein C0622_03975 [Desulfuromonas sp.]